MHKKDWEKLVSGHKNHCHGYQLNDLGPENDQLGLGNNCYDFDWFILYSRDQRQSISMMFSSVDSKDCLGFYSKVLS